LARITEADYLRRPPEAIPARTPWKSHYLGVFGAHYLPDAYGRARGDVLLVGHGENKNESRRIDGALNWYQNAVNPEALATPGALGGYPFGRSDVPGGNPRALGSPFPCPGGYVNLDALRDEAISGSRAYVPADLSSTDDALGGRSYYSNCHEGYNGFVTTGLRAASTPSSWVGRGRLRDSEDNGPVIWPSAGYVDDRGRKVSWGVRHPSSFVHDGYLYIFYLDTSDSPDVNHGIIKVARSPLSAKGAPGSFTSWNPRGPGMHSAGT